MKSFEYQLFQSIFSKFFEFLPVFTVKVVSSNIRGSCILIYLDKPESFFRIRILGIIQERNRNCATGYGLTFFSCDFNRSLMISINYVQTYILINNVHALNTWNLFNDICLNVLLLGPRNSIGFFVQVTDHRKHARWEIFIFFVIAFNFCLFLLFFLLFFFV